jgi:hypothetical protein
MAAARVRCPRAVDDGLKRSLIKPVKCDAAERERVDLAIVVV